MLHDSQRQPAQVNLIRCSGRRVDQIRFINSKKKMEDAEITRKTKAQTRCNEKKGGGGGCYGSMLLFD